MTASNTTDSTAFDITDWLGEWESFEHYIDSDDAAIQQTWEAAEQAVLAIVAAETARRGDCRMAVGHMRV